MADDPVLNKVLGPLFTVEAAPFRVEPQLPMESMFTVEVGVRGSSLNPQGGYIRRFDNGEPAPTLGNNNDIYVDLDNFDIYQKYSTTWTLIGNLIGPTGATGAQGPQGIQGIQGAQGDTGATGATGAAGADGISWTSGAGAPTGGADDDLYLRTSNYDLYKKIAGVWTVIGNILGATGATGATGAAGADGADGTDGATWIAGAGAPSGGVDGDLYLNTSNSDVYQKSGGSWSVITNIKGDAGTGGAAGNTWYTGAGVPSGGTGADGDQYLRTSNGDVYLKSGGSWSVSMNLTGPTGATGATGATGSTGSTGSTGAAGADFPAKSIVTKTAAYTLTNTEFAGNVLIKANSGSAFALTLNTGLTGVEPCNVFQYGAGQITISGSATIRHAVGPKTRAQYSTLSIIPLGSDEYLIVGDTAA